MAHFTSIDQIIGSTPLVSLNRLTRNAYGSVQVKLESQNPMGSVKDRIALAIINDAEQRGLLKPGSTIVEATSGNTGIALAYLGASRGYKVILTMPETMSIERRRLLKAFGAQVELTPGNQGMGGSVSRARELVQTIPGAFWARQFENEANPAIHEQTTAREIWEDTKGNIDVFVAGVGTGGSLTGVGRFLRDKNPDIEIIALEPDTSSVLSGGTPGPHKIQGIGPGFIPQILDTALISQTLKVSAVNAGETARALATQEGILGGISAGANVWAALELANRKAYQGKNIVTLICDTGERYLSTWLFDE